MFDETVVVLLAAWLLAMLMIGFAWLAVVVANKPKETERADTGSKPRARI